MSLSNEVDNWSWRKLFSGFFNGKNYAKAIVIGTCQIVIVVIIACVFLTAKSVITRNQGTINQHETKVDSHNKQESKTGVSFQLFKFG